MYYGLVMVAVLMFGFQFFFNEEYQRENGNDTQATMLFIMAGSAVGLIVLLIINGFSLHYTHFTLIMAVVTAINNMLCSICSLKALGRINLSRFSLFSMLGGMVLPFCAGIMFFNEKLTVGMIICLIAVFGAMLMTLQKGESRGGTIYYIGVFVFNGMAGVLSKMFQALPFEKASAADYSILTAAVTAVLAGIILLFSRKRKIPVTPKLILHTGGYGILNKVANYLLLLALVHLPASVQYPMVTGGVMIVSTLLAYFTPKKPSKRELVALVLSFIGITALII